MCCMQSIYLHGSFFQNKEVKISGYFPNLTRNTFGLFHTYIHTFPLRVNSIMGYFYSIFTLFLHRLHTVTVC